MKRKMEFHYRLKKELIEEMFMDIFERIDFKCYRENFNAN